MKFRNGSSTVLICTDLGSRGLDIPDVNHIIHYQYPGSREAFIHRTGRTARMSANGNSYLLKGPSVQIPDYMDLPNSTLELKQHSRTATLPEWTTLYFSAGKKDKVNKIDIVGFLMKKGNLAKDEIGLITVNDHACYAAVNREKAKTVLNRVRNEKVKGKRLKIEFSK
jgi:ATP-independent RNA helicase DbpA